MQDRAFANEKISFRWNTQVVDVLGAEKTSGLLLRDTVTGEESKLDVTGLFVAIGHDPRTELFADQVRLTSTGFVEVEGRSSRTSLPGVFACGDVVDHEYMQAITAAGSGCVAALDAERYLAARADDPVPVREEVTV
jgi:thioredoxin reductase (NADPH)